MNMNEVQPEESRGSMLLASVMTVSFGVLLFLGMVSSTMSEKLRTEQVVQTARALQLAHTGIEYALWEINYGENDFTAPWTADGANRWRCLPATPTCPGSGMMNVLVDKDPDLDANPATGNWTITSSGTNQGMTRRVSVSVPPLNLGPATPSIFNQMMYTRNGNIYLKATGGGSIVLGGYNSSTSDPLGDPAAAELLVRSDQTPWHETSCDSDPASCAGRDNVAAVIFEGNVTANVKVVTRDPTVGEAASKLLNEALSGYFIHPGVTWGGLTEQDTNSGGIVYSVKSKPSNYGDGAYVLRPGDTGVICPGETLNASEVYVEGATMVLGCTLGGAYPCDSYPAKYDPRDGQFHPCSYFDSTILDPAVLAQKKVTILTGDGGLYSMGVVPGDPYSASGSGYALVVRADPNNSAVKGEIRVYNKTEIYYDQPGAGGGSLLGLPPGDNGLYIGSGGMVNTVLTTAGKVDPSALVIYGGASTLTDNSHFATSAPFYGAIFSPRSNIVFENSALLELYGSLNVQQIRTNSNVKIYWDKALKAAFPGQDGGGTCSSNAQNCRRPIPGTWTLTNS